VAKNGQGNHTWELVLGFKYMVVALAAVAVGAHLRLTTPRGKAISGALGLLASLAAMVLGVVLAG
jgi:hypothetical protein